MKKIKPQHNKTKKSVNAGFSLVELLIVVVILGILASLSVLYIFSARRAANTTSALSAMRTIHQTQASYSAGVGNGSFTDENGLYSEEYIDAALAAACVPTPTSTTKGGAGAPIFRPKSGYQFTITSSTDPKTYSATSRPIVTSGQALSGDKTFFIDQTGVLRASSQPIDTADSNSAPVN